MNNITDMQREGQTRKACQIFFCDSCNMQFPNRKLYEIHKKQQTHIMNEKVHGTKGNTSNNQRSGIYVRGKYTNILLSRYSFFNFFFNINIITIIT